jgi:hypothetical protein
VLAAIQNGSLGSGTMPANVLQATRLSRSQTQSAPRGRLTGMPLRVSEDDFRGVEGRVIGGRIGAQPACRS